MDHPHHGSSLTPAEEGLSQLPRKKKPKKRNQKEMAGHPSTDSHHHKTSTDTATMSLGAGGPGNHLPKSNNQMAGTTTTTSGGGGGKEERKKSRKQRKLNDSTTAGGANHAISGNSNNNNTATHNTIQGGSHHISASNPTGGTNAATHHSQHPPLSAAQMVVNEQMRRALEEDQYSAQGSIVDTDSDEDDTFLYRGQPIRLDRTALLHAVRKYNNWRVSTTTHAEDEDEDDEDRSDVAALATVVNSTIKGGAVLANENGGNGNNNNNSGIINNKGQNNKKKKKDDMLLDKDIAKCEEVPEDDFDRDGGSIFGQTTGASNSTWVECDKCKKWRRLRGVVDEKKLPSKWYCSMNKNDPERARCSAPEEEYETPHTPESAADARTRKHLRIWVRRLQCNEAYEARQPTLTRGKKRAVASTSKDPYEWVRCCNPSCGKWRSLLRMMDAKSAVLDRAVDGEWYCVMNTWDEKMASCAAPQENLPAIGVPPWVMQDEE